jgi:hypothetical protein
MVRGFFNFLEKLSDLEQFSCRLNITVEKS